MPQLKMLHVASQGSRPSRSGRVVNLTKDDIEELAESYRPDLHQCKVAVDDVATAVQLGAPAVLGHLDPRLIEAKGAMPAFGRVLDAKALGGDLYLDLELTDSMADWIEQGLYDHVSVSWYERSDPRNPTPGKLHLRHIGWLGAEPSAMKDLQLPDPDMIEYSEAELNCAYGYLYGEEVAEDGTVQVVYYSVSQNTAPEIIVDIEFSEETTMATMSKTAKVNPDVTDMAENPQNDTEQDVTGQQTAGVDAVAPDANTDDGNTDDANTDETVTKDAATNTNTVDPVLMLTSVLQDGDKGYKGEISEYRPMPTPENNYLWDEDKEQFSGQFVDLSGNDEEVYDFSLKLQPDGSMVRSYMLVSVGGQPTDQTVEEEADTADMAVDMSECKKPKKSVDMSEGYMDDMGMDNMGGYGSPTVSPTVQISQEDYNTLCQQAALAQQLLAEKEAAQLAAKLEALEEALEPLYELGLIDGYVPSETLAKAILAMDNSAKTKAYYGTDYEHEDDDYELEFSEGRVLKSPFEVVVATLGSIATNVKAKREREAETEIEFGEALIDMPPGYVKAASPVGTVADPRMAELDQRARQICAENGWDPNKDYLKALRLAQVGKLPRFSK